jgi:beta-lactamase superfamily II metal-dependent hydrolase
MSERAVSHHKAWRMSMPDYFEIDFLDVETKKSGDAIAVRYSINNQVYIHIVDAGYQITGQAVVDHVKKYYGNPGRIDHVIATHPDGDHVGGLKDVLEKFQIGTLWMLRPWLYASEIIHRFSKFTSISNLVL